MFLDDDRAFVASAGSANAADAAPPIPVNVVTEVQRVAGGPEMANARRVTVVMKPAFRRCYRKEFAANGFAAKGQTSIEVQIGAGGEVLGASAATNPSLPKAMLACFESRVKSAQFDPPSPAAEARIRIDVTIAREQQ